MCRSSIGHAERLRLEAPPAAGRAGALHHVLLELGADVLRFRLPVATLEVGDDALEGGHVGVLAALVPVAHLDPLAAPGEEEVVERLRRQVPRWARGSPSRARP